MDKCTYAIQTQTNKVMTRRHSSNSCRNFVHLCLYHMCAFVHSYMWLSSKWLTQYVIRLGVCDKRYFLHIVANFQTITMQNKFFYYLPKCKRLDTFPRKSRVELREFLSNLSYKAYFSFRQYKVKVCMCTKATIYTRDFVKGKKWDKSGK